MVQIDIDYEFLCCLLEIRAMYKAIIEEVKLREDVRSKKIVTTKHLNNIADINQQISDYGKL